MRPAPTDLRKRAVAALLEAAAVDMHLADAGLVSAVLAVATSQALYTLARVCVYAPIGVVVAEQALVRWMAEQALAMQTHLAEAASPMLAPCGVDSRDMTGHPPGGPQAGDGTCRCGSCEPCMQLVLRGPARLIHLADDGTGGPFVLPSSGLPLGPSLAELLGHGAAGSVDRAVASLATSATRARAANPKQGPRQQRKAGAS